MATIIRCDECKRASDEVNIGAIGRKWDIYFGTSSYGRHKDVLMNIVVFKDLCKDCMKKILADPDIRPRDEE